MFYDLPSQVLVAFGARRVGIVNGYGLTEAGGFSKAHISGNFRFEHQVLEMLVGFFRNLPQMSQAKWEPVEPDTQRIEESKFRAIYPKVDWSIQLDYAQQIGLGRRDYELERV